MSNTGPVIYSILVERAGLSIGHSFLNSLMKTKSSSPGMHGERQRPKSKTELSMAKSFLHLILHWLLLFLYVISFYVNLSNSVWIGKQMSLLLTLSLSMNLSQKTFLSWTIRQWWSSVRLVDFGSLVLLCFIQPSCGYIQSIMLLSYWRLYR